MSSNQLFFIGLFSATLAGCNDVEIGRSKDVNPESVYFDYKIAASEENENVSCMFIYKFGGPNGTTLVLDEPSKVEFDGQTITADSARYTGVYYEVVRPVRAFSGKHNIVFTGSDKKQYSQEFEFKPFKLAEALPEKIPRKAFTIRLQDFPARETPLHLVMIDTAFASNDVNETISVINGQVEISQIMLDKLKAGPVTIELNREEEQPLLQKTKEGGKLLLRYGLKREFLLTDLQPKQRI